MYDLMFIYLLSLDTNVALCRLCLTETIRNASAGGDSQISNDGQHLDLDRNHHHHSSVTPGGFQS